MGPPYPETHSRVGSAILAVLVAVACSEKPDAGDSIERHIQVIRELTFPPGASGLLSSGLERTQWSARLSSEFQIDWSWEDYARWVGDRLRNQGGFAQSADSRGSLTFIKHLPGDTHTVRVEQVKPGPPLLVRVVFRAWPS